MKLIQSASLLFIVFPTIALAASEHDSQMLETAPRELNKQEFEGVSVLDAGKRELRFDAFEKTFSSFIPEAVESSEVDLSNAAPSASDRALLAETVSDTKQEASRELSLRDILNSVIEDIKKAIPAKDDSRGDGRSNHDRDDRRYLRTSSHQESSVAERKLSIFSKIRSWVSGTGISEDSEDDGNDVVVTNPDLPTNPNFPHPIPSHVLGTP